MPESDMDQLSVDEACELTAEMLLESLSTPIKGIPSVRIINRVAAKKLIMAAVNVVATSPRVER